MISLLNAFSRNSLNRLFKGSFQSTSVKRPLQHGLGHLFIALFLCSFPLFSITDALALPTEDTLTLSIEPSPESKYTNYAQKGSYEENGTQYLEVPQWHYYDMFGNKILDGFYLYGLSMSRNNVNTGMGNVALHPFYRMWFSGLVQVADIQQDGGVMALIGDRVKSQFTPFSLNQTLFGGSRFDITYKKTSLTMLTNRISNTGAIGALITTATQTGTADWITGAHANQRFGEDVVDVGATWTNLHHEEKTKLGNPFSGRDSDTLTRGTYTGLTLRGLDLKLNLPNLQMSGELLKSQEYLDGTFKPKSGTVATISGRWDIIDRWKLGGEGYTVGSRFQTNFSCPAHPKGDVDQYGDVIVGKYQYSLVEDNDDKDEFPENGRSRYNNYTDQDRIKGQGDPDGAIPGNWDKDKNGIWDYEEDFLSYDADPPETKILFDRNNNGIPDEVEDDAYPDYTYVPSYYLPGERYYRYDDIDTVWKSKWADSLTHKGLAGVHLYTRFEVFQGLELTLGGIFDRSQEKSFQPTYENGVQTGEVYAAENASNLYFLAHFKKELARDKSITIDDFARKVNDNIPNHTQEFELDPETEMVKYYTIIDELDHRDMFANALRAEFSLFQNRGFNYTAAGKYEFQNHTPHLNFNYAKVTTNSISLINKAHYIIALPFLKDMFLIPKYKNLWEISGYGPRPDTLDPMFNSSFDYRYRRNSMINQANLVFEWKITGKTNVTVGGHGKLFNEFKVKNENYFEPGYRIQFQIHDRYSGVIIVLTTGFAQYSYYYAKKGIHNPLNNPHRAIDNMDDHEIFVRLHCGF